MRYRRLVLGVLAVIVALFVIVGEQMSGASADAVVNAPVVTVRATVAGNLAVQPRQLGARVTQGEVLASLQDPVVDRVRLDDLLMEARFEEAAHTQMATLLTETEALRASLAERTEIYRERRLEELRARLSHAEAQLATAEAPGQEAAPASIPGGSGGAGEAGTEALSPDQMRERVDVLRIALRAAEQNVFLGDGYNDAPNAEQRAVELSSQIAELQTGLVESEARTAALQERIARERLRVNNLTGGDIAAPVSGLLWEVLQAHGVNVQRGDPLLRLVDCQAALVTASVTESVYNRLVIGQEAQFRLGGSSTVYPATVARLAGSGAETVYHHLAVAPSQRHLERYDVALVVPGLDRSGSEGCLIGRTGRVFFDSRPMDWLRELVN